MQNTKETKNKKVNKKTPKGEMIFRAIILVLIFAIILLAYIFYLDKVNYTEEIKTNENNTSVPVEMVH